ncbi:MerR family transcriptional regulator [Anaerolentibacter hominis]|uniref:MerR family transcriptional regulator n=1 Tax=Anaerolentibacter hominis TaxID=3079009 RepID=UPI0031B7ED09
MTYSISETAEKMNLTPSTIRFYEKEGILSNVRRTNKGIRYFTEEDMDTLSMVCCLKDTGMCIREIRHYFELCEKGDSTLPERLEIFLNHRKYLLNEIETMNKYLDKINFKIEWYKRLCQEKGEKA